MARRGIKRSQKNTIQNVRITDPAAGTDSLKVDRQISQVKTSESQTRILIGDVIDVDIQPTDTIGSYGFTELFATDDFVSMIQQYRTFRVSSIKFNVVDVNTGVAVRNVFATFHDVYTSSAPPAFSRQNISDQPDALVVAPGHGMQTFYWVAHGVEENRFQSGTSVGATASKFGGLRFYIGTGQNVAKYVVEVHAVVDFRGRA